MKTETLAEILEYNNNFTEEGDYILSWPCGSIYNKLLNGFDCIFQYGLAKITSDHILTLQEAKEIRISLLTRKQVPFFWDISIKKYQ